MARKKPAGSMPPRRVMGFFGYLRSNNKLGVFISCMLLFVLMIAAMLIPLLFREDGPAPEHSGQFALKARLFADYWASSESGYSVSRIQEPESGSERFCADRFEELVGAFRVDGAREPAVSVEGSEYVELRRGGVSFRLCRKWIQYTGDWVSWLDVCFDMDTGEIFYLYTNGECIYNGSEYADTVFFTDTAELAGAFGEELGLELYHYGPGSGDTSSATAIYLDEDTPVKTELSLVYIAGSLFDVKIVCV